MLSVIVFHYGAPFPWPLLPGGFTGVDVFFVISGFLITQQLYSDIQGGHFSILNFYDRRVRRIMPALLVMLAVTLLAGRWILIPGDYMSLAASTGAATFGASNFYFLFNTGYFDQSAELLPLLHTWSLGVEEQFYLVWPLLLFGLAKIHERSNIAAIIAAAVIVSFGVSLVWFEVDPKAAFFMVAPRAWELAIGALLVFLPPLPRLAGNLSVPVGISLIVAGFFAADAQAFPGPSALLPCLGAALVIWPRISDSAVANWLGRLRPIGLISYSLYLWHWPIWVYFRIYINNGTPRIRETVALAAVSVVLAILSYFFIEQPIRRRTWTALVKTGLAACCALFCAAMFVHSDDGIPERLPQQVSAMRSLDVMWGWDCQSAIPSGLNQTYCTFGAPWSTATARALLWGDSHAGHMAPLIEAATQANTTSFLLYTDCPASFGGHVFRVWPEVPRYVESCKRQRENGIKLLRDDSTIDLVILAASWAPLPKRASQDGYFGSDLSGLDLIESGIRDLIAQTSRPGRRFIIVGSVPQIGHDVVPCALTDMLGLLRRPCESGTTNPTLESIKVHTAETDDMILRIAHDLPDVTALIPTDRMCASARCNLYLDNEFLYRDASHIRRNLKLKTRKDLADVMGLTEALNATPRLLSVEAMPMSK